MATEVLTCSLPFRASPFVPQLCDQDGDGIISKQDLEGLLTSLGTARLVGTSPEKPGLTQADPLPNVSAPAGQPITPAKLSALLATASQGPSSSAPLNFTAFVTLLASHLSPLDPEPELLAAFASFDEDESGFVKEEDLKRALGSGRDGLEADEVSCRPLAAAQPSRTAFHLPFPRPESRKDRKTNRVSSFTAAFVQISALLHPPFFDAKTRLFNYRLFCQTLRVTDPADDAPAAGAPSLAP